MNFDILKAKALEKGIKEIEIYSSKGSSIELSAFDGMIEGNNISLTDVCCIRGVYNNHIATVYSENSNDDAIDFILDTIIQNATLIDKNEPYFIYGGDDKYTKVKDDESDFDKFSQKDKADLLIKINEILKSKSDLVFKTDAGYQESESEIAIINTNGLNVSKKNKSAYLVVELIVKKGEETKTAYDYFKINKFKDINLDEFTDKLLKEALGMFGAEPVISNEYNIVLDKKCVRSLLGAYCSAFFADEVIKKMSFLADKEGEKIFGDNINIYDDPLNELAVTRDSFDDEGVATYKKAVVSNGILNTYLHNLTTAAMMNKKTTGNGFKYSIASPVAVNADNFYLEPGQYSLDALFEMAKDGLYITEFDGLNAGINQTSGAYSLKCEGYLIKNGKLDRPVNLIIMSSSFQETLNNVVAIGNDFEFKGSVGASSILLNKMAISGK